MVCDGVMAFAVFNNGHSSITMARSRRNICAFTNTGCAAAHKSMWQILNDDDEKEKELPAAAAAWKTLFGPHGERGEYMDGYSQEAMEERCLQDYGFISSPSTTAEADAANQRAAMMSHLYRDNKQLWKHTSMVAFAEHYITTQEMMEPFNTFKNQQSELQPPEEPIFGGVVFRDWEAALDDSHQGIQERLAAFREKGLDYIRLECNFGSVEDIGRSAQLTEDPRFGRLAEVSRQCQKHKMIPLLLIQVPWRESGGVSIEYFGKAVKCLAESFKKHKVDSKRVLLESRPPIGLSAQEESNLGEKARIELGLQIGRTMFELIDDAFEIAGFCVAGGSTKGEFPTAMEDQTQNAVRQGIRQRALQKLGYELCFWEMGAKLMLQPEVGQLWAKGEGNAARALFGDNAKAMADEIKTEMPDPSQDFS